MAQQTFTGRKRVRKFFGHIKEVAEMPNLIEVQKASYDQFLMVDEPPGGRLDEGLQAVFRSVFPISDFSGTSMLEFVRYEFEPPKYDVDECRQRGMTYAAPLKVTLRLIVFDIDEETGAKSVKDIKEQDVYMGDIPLMTMNGTFDVNGTERVIVSQMHRSRAYRPPPQDSRDLADVRARSRWRNHPEHVLQEVQLQADQGRLARAVRRHPVPRLLDHQRPDRCRHRQGGARGRKEADRARRASVPGKGPQGAAA